MSPKDSGGSGKRGGNAGERALRAQELIYEAWELSDAQRRQELAQEALGLDRNCADAYLLLAEASDDPLQRADLCRQAVDAGTRSLGQEVFRREHGHFWLLLETRPYMRARARLGQALTDLGLPREAASHFRELLTLDLDDNLGARHRLAELLLELGEIQELTRLLERFEDERAPVDFHYTRALLAYRAGDRSQAQELLETAVALNSHVPGYLLGDRPLPEELPETSTLGDEREASLYAAGARQGWLETPGALRWLVELAAGEAPREVVAQAYGHDEPLARIEAEQASTAGRRARSGEHPSLEGSAAEVARLLHQELGARGYDSDLQARAVDLWGDFFRAWEPTIRKPAIHAAALEYVVTRLAGATSDTQAGIASHYGVSASSVSRAAHAINAWLEAALGNAALGSGGVPLDDGSAVLPIDDETLGELLLLPRTTQRWHGALRVVPFQVVEPRLHRPTLALWYDEQNASILGQELYGPTVPGHALFHTLIQSFYAPLDGEPRLPEAVRVEDESQAEQIGEALAPLGIEVECGALPAIGELMKSLESFLVTPNSASYCEGDVTEELVERFFRGAAVLRRAASWNFVSEGQVLGIDLDHWDLGRVCVSVVGSSGYERGLLIFTELDDYLRYFRHAAMSELDGALVGAPVDMLSLVFEHGAELEPSLRREVFKHGWEVVGPEDYPLLVRIDGDGGTTPLSAADYRLATVCAEAVALYCEHNHRLFCGEQRGPIRERIPLEHSDELDKVYVVAPHPV